VRVCDYDACHLGCRHALAQQVHHKYALCHRQETARKVELHPLLGGALVVDDGRRHDTTRDALFLQLLLVLLGRVEEEHQVLWA